MKITVKILGLYLLFCSSVLSAQNLQKWYADDIYYNSTEKEVNVIEIVEYSEYDNEIDTLEESFYNQMSYTSRINRFHRDYFGTSLGFNYGYFHDPFLFNGFGFNYGLNYGFDPFFNYGFGFNYGFNPFFGFGYYNPWYSPWGMNQFAWYDPYGFGFYGGFGYGYNPYFFNSGLTLSSGNTYYGPRTFSTNNVVSTSIINPVKRSSGSNRIGINKTQKPTSKINSVKVIGNEKYNIPKNKQTRWELSNSVNYNKTEKKSLISRIEQILGSDTSQPRVNPNKSSSNRKNKSNYNRSPQRNSNTTRTAPRSTPRINRNSANSRRPR